MKPTDEQLRDPKWWDENAPLWAKVIIGPCQNGHFWWFDQFSGEGKARHISSEEWRNVNTVQPHSWDVVARPTKPAAPEWDGEGLPPVGCICECLFNDGWSKVAVLAHYGDESWVKRPRKTHIVSKGLGNEFRPIRTKEQRERDELLQIISNAYESFESRADAIIAAGWRKGDS